MPICIECRYPVKTLYTEYSGADDKSTGHGVRLTVCKNCGSFCDKYVEHDFVVLFIDLVLIKPQVYRHLLHNSFTSPTNTNALPRSILRLGILLILFDVYLTWARIERALPAPTTALYTANASYTGLGAHILAEQPIVTQYLFFLVLCVSSTLAFHCSIRFLTSSWMSPLRFLPGGVFPYARPNSVSTALLVSSSTKLFPILMVIWEYDVPAAARSLGWAVVANNIEALKILLDCGYPVSCGLVAVGAAARLVVARAILWAVGLEGLDGGGQNVFGHVKGWHEGGGGWELVRDWGGRMGGL